MLVNGFEEISARLGRPQEKLHHRDHSLGVLFYVDDTVAATLSVESEPRILA